MASLASLRRSWTHEVSNLFAESITLAPTCPSSSFIALVRQSLGRHDLLRGAMLQPRPRKEAEEADGSIEAVTIDEARREEISNKANRPHLHTYNAHTKGASCSSPLNPLPFPSVGALRGEHVDCHACAMAPSLCHTASRRPVK